MSKKLIILGIIVTLILVAGCSLGNTDGENEISQTEQLLKSIEAENDTLRKENAFLNKRVDDLQEGKSTLTTIVDEQELIISSSNDKEFRENYDVLPIYTANIDSYDKEINYYIVVPKNVSIEEKVKVVADKLSKYSFNSLPIELLEIKKVEGKNVAVINLKEHPENEGITEPVEIIGYTWRMHYFQGSTGGTITSTKLIETFLQRDYSGEWVDGVVFLHENSSDSFDHVPTLFEINYRK